MKERENTMKKETVKNIISTLENMNNANQLIYDIQLESDKLIQISELNSIDEKLCKIKQINLYINIDTKYSKKLFRCHLTAQSFNANQVYNTAVNYTDALQLRKQKSNYYIADYKADRIADIIHALQRSVYDYLLECKKISVDEYKAKFEFADNIEIAFETSSKADKKQAEKQA